MARPTLLDIVKANGADPAVGLIEEVVPYVPELELFEARSIKGINFKTLVRTSLPSVGFRVANEGTAAVKSTYENRLVECFMMNPRWECDKLVADGYEDGAEAFIAMEGVGIVKAAGITVGKQIYYGIGTGGDAKGFPGMLASVDSTMVLDATGTTDNVCSSVWAVKFGPQDSQLIVGMNGQLELGEVRTETIYDASSNPLDGYVQTLAARIGFAVYNKYAIGRIKKLTTDSGKGLTDSLLSQLYEKFPVGHQPDAFIMTRRSRGQLQRSRTATTTNGAPAPLPTDWEGIPIVVTDSLVDTETLAL